MHRQSRQTKTIFLTWLWLSGSLASLAAHPAQAARGKSGDERTVELPVGGSQVLRVNTSMDRIIVGDPAILDVVALPPGQLLLTAKTSGETELTVWSRQSGAQSFHISASVPVGSLQQALRDAFPGEDDLQAHASGGAVYLTGSVTDAAVTEAAIRLANGLMTTGGRKVADVVNLTTLSSSQQVQVQLKFVEVSRTSLKQLGFNAWANQTDSKGGNYTGGVMGTNDPRSYSDPSQNFVGATPGNNPNAGPLPMLLSPVQGAFSLSFSMSRYLPLSMTLSLLEGRGVAKTLSEPTLVANSGEQAHFIVGGEFPIPVPDPLGRVIVQFKPYGTQLTFTPTVVAQDTVHLTLDAVVSDIDRQNTTTVGSSQVPGITTRESSTSVRMRDGQSFAIAGLLSDHITAQDKKIPILGDIPVLGMFFRNTSYQRNQEELVVLVSTRMVKPMDAGEVPPIVSEDEFNDPSDWSLFLLGSIDKAQAKSDKAGEPRAAAAPAGVPRKVTGPRSQAAAGGLMGFSR